jgi:hypothetical protein
MSDTQFIDNLVRYDCFGVLNNTAKDYNEAVTRLALNNENTFTEKLLIAMVRNQWINSATQKAAVAFCYEKILEKRQPKNYVPELTSEWPSWAIDSDGLAYHYKATPRLRENMWIRQQWVVDNVHGIQVDENFDSNKYKHMWADGAWKNSLKSK